MIVTKKKVSKGFIVPSGSGGLLGKKPKAPKSVNNTGYSNSNFQSLAGLSEGTIGGLTDGLKSVYIDDTPLQNAD